MKKLLGLFLAFAIATPALAQWQVPNHSVPIGRGTGQGFKFVGPCAADVPIVGQGASSDPACSSHGAITGFANPTAQVGLTTVNGSATTAMRSDAAPPINQSISPTWTGTHIFNNAVTAAAFIPFSSSVPTNGMYLPSANTLGLAANSTVSFLVQSNALFSNNSSGPRLNNSDASSTVPSVIPNRTDSTTGIGAQASGNISEIVGGVEKGRWTSTGLNNAAIGQTTAAAGAFTTVVGTTFNGMSITTCTGCGFAISNSKTATIQNSFTASGTDGSTLAFRTGGTIGYVIASGTKALATSAISSATCTPAQTVTATGTTTTDVVNASFNGDPTAVTGFVPLVTGMLTIIPYPTADTVNFKVCNNTGSSITPGAITLNWQVVR